MSIFIKILPCEHTETTFNAQVGKCSKHCDLHVTCQVTAVIADQT